MFITDHKLIIVIIVKSANICIHCIYRKSFRTAYSQLGMLGACSCIKYINFPWNCRSRNHCSESQWRNIFYTTRPYTGDDKIKVLLLLYTAKLQIMRNMVPPTVIYLLSLWTLYIDNIIGTFDLKTVSLG